MDWKFRVAACVIAAAASVSSAPAEWRVLSSREEPSARPDIVHRHLDLRQTETDDSATLDLAIFPARACALRVIQNDERRGDLADAMPRSGCVAGINGGYFDPAFQPLGLRIVDGQTRSPLTHGRLMSGIVASNGSVQVLRVGEFSRSRKLRAALECGPMLADAGTLVRGLEATRSARRTFVATDGKGRAALGSSSNLTLAGLAGVLAEPLGDFKILRALNLDGGSSTAFWFRRESGDAFSISEDKTVRDFIGIVPK
jgi:hypothetical protein